MRGKRFSLPPPTFLLTSSLAIPFPPLARLSAHVRSFPSLLTRQYPPPCLHVVAVALLLRRMQNVRSPGQRRGQRWRLHDGFVSYPFSLLILSSSLVLSWHDNLESNVPLRCFVLRLYVLCSWVSLSSEKLGKKKTLEAFPMLKEKGLAGGVVYYDGQHNDSRMNMALILSAVSLPSLLACLGGWRGAKRKRDMHTHNEQTKQDADSVVFGSFCGWFAFLLGSPRSDRRQLRLGRGTSQRCQRQDQRGSMQG